jgi:hypothetical protein
LSIGRRSNFEERYKKEVTLMKVKFEREKETRNTIKYHEVAERGKPPIIGTLYLQKWYAGGCREVTLTIEKESSKENKQLKSL